MRSYRCSACSSFFTEADKQWDMAIKLRQCPKCKIALNDFPVSNASNSKPSIRNDKDEEDIYSQVMSELEYGSLRQGIWAKAFSESEGDDAKSRALYIKLRVQQEISNKSIVNLESKKKEESIEDIESSDGFFTKLSRGDYGLAKTYWMYGFLVRIPFTILLLALATTKTIFSVTLLSYYAYEALIISGTWNSAKKYDGPKIWSILARISCVLGVLILLTESFKLLRTGSI